MVESYEDESGLNNKIDLFEVKFNLDDIRLF